MFSSFWRRPTVALIAILAVLLPISLIGIQSTASASNAQPAKSLEGRDTPNPTIGKAFGEKVVITATQYGLDFKFSGYTQGGRNTLISIEGQFCGVYREIPLSWKGTTYNHFVRLSKADNFYGQVPLNNPNSGWGVTITYRLVVPQVGTSNLTITSNLLPAARVGVRYLFRFTARGGKPPYRWMLISGRFSGLPKGLYFIRTGSEAGTITGIPQVTGSFSVPVIVRDKVGHSAFTLLNQLQVTA
jgi:hypothetical protein